MPSCGAAAVAHSDATAVKPDRLARAVIYAALGAKDTAFAYLDNEYARGSWWLNFAKVDPDLDEVRDHTRFQAMMAQADARLAATV